jgi:hypothetical protein
MQAWGHGERRALRGCFCQNLPATEPLAQGMRLLLLLGIALLIAAGAAVPALWPPEPDVAAAMDRWNVLVAEYHTRAEGGEYDREAFLREAAPIAVELREYRQAGWVADEHWQGGPEVFVSDGYYGGPNDACNHLHDDWIALLEDICGSKMGQRQITEPPIQELPPEQPPIEELSPEQQPNQGPAPEQPEPRL